jgi:transcriptional regulator with XRE-family HTH domain
MDYAMRMERHREDLSAFLRAHRERVSPASAGLPAGTRRRTPGLRREEVAALAGVGLTWYTWLEQGRNISVSAALLDSLARVFKLSAAERRHLFLLAHARPPAEPAATWCIVPPLIHRLMADMHPHPAYVLNLRWDILAFNTAANTLFGFDKHVPSKRNLLWLLFTDPHIQTCFIDWETQAPQMLASFRRDFARAAQDGDIVELVDDLKRVSSEFKQWWQHHDVDAPCSGVKQLMVDNTPTAFDHTSLIIDEDRHLRLVIYAAQQD